MTDIYQSPESELIDTVETSGELASRWSRLWASILDTFILLIPVFALAYSVGLFDLENIDREPSATQNVIISLATIAAFFVINIKFLLDNGQTLGKKALGIKIVANNGSAASFGNQLIPRYLVYFIPGQFPGIGQTFSMVNVLFIFRKDKRCVHDLVAGTRVVRC